MDEDRLSALLSALSLLVQQRRLGLSATHLTRVGVSLGRAPSFGEIHALLSNLCLFGRTTRRR
jgi:hypothetical protein